MLGAVSQSAVNQKHEATLIHDSHDYQVSLPPGTHWPSNTAEHATGLKRRRGKTGPESRETDPALREN